MLSVVIPMYNEEKYVLKTVNTLVPYLNGLQIGYEIIFSDDGSRDSGAGIVSALSEKYSCIKLIVTPENTGKGGALKAGIKRASGEYIICTDCRLSYGTECIGKIYDRLRLGEAQIVAGSRAIHPLKSEGSSVPAKLISDRISGCLRKKDVAFTYADPQCGVKGMTDSAAKAILPECVTSGVAFHYEMLLTADLLGIKSEEFPVRISRREQISFSLKPIADTVDLIKDLKVMKNTHFR